MMWGLMSSDVGVVNLQNMGLFIGVEGQQPEW